MLKKIAVTGLLTLLTSMSCAQTCPSENELFSWKKGRININSVPGWVLISASGNYFDGRPRFSMAAWGDHKHNSSPVRCHYYTDGSAHVEVSSAVSLGVSAVAGHSQWSAISDDRYYLCSSSDVNSCSFG